MVFRRTSIREISGVLYGFLKQEHALRAMKIKICRIKQPDLLMDGRKLMLWTVLMESNGIVGIFQQYVISFLIMFLNGSLCIIELPGFCHA